MTNKMILALLMLVLCAPSANSQNTIDLNSLPSVANLTTVVSNPGADTVILCSHGGPTSTLLLTDFTFYQAIPTFSTVYVKQYQHYNPDILNNNALTLSQAIVCNDTGVAILRKVVNHYNNLGKVVVITGHSFGSFLIPEYLDDYGNADIHRVIPMAGRLNMNDTIWKEFEAGNGGGFDPNDGITLNLNTSPAPSSEWARMKLMAGYGYNRFTDSLAHLNLNNMMYLYGDHDEAVGRLLPDEVSFLTSKYATVVNVPSGDHGSMFANTYMNQALDFIRNGSVLSVRTKMKQTPKITPTLVKHHLKIDVEEEGNLTVYSITGQVVLNKKCKNKTEILDCSSLQNGTYIVYYLTEDNTFHSQKIIKY